MNFLKKLFNNVDGNSMEVFEKASYSLIVKLIGILGGFMLSIFLGRTIGSEGIGLISLGNKIINIAIIISLIGTRQVIVKEVAISVENRNFTNISSFLKSAFILNGSLAILIVLLILFLAPFFSINLFNEEKLEIPLLILSIALIPQVISRLISAGLIGFRKIWQSNLVEQALSVIVTSVAVFGYWKINGQINVIQVAYCYLLGRLIMFIVVGVYWNSLFNFRNYKKGNNLVLKKLITTSFPIFISTVSGVIIANGDVIFLGIFENSSVVGLYAVGARVGTLTSLFLLVTNSAVGPKVAQLNAKGNIEGLQIMIKRVTRPLFVLGIVVWILFALFGKPLLSLWGSQFIEAYPILLIIGFGQFVNLSTGAVGLILIMTGNEKIQGRISSVFMLYNITSSIFLGYFFGAIGIAISAATTIAGENLIRTYYVKKLVGISIYK